MSTGREKACRWHSESGATLYIVAGGMVMLLGVSALAIDMASFYLARGEAQRAADAAALAGAAVFRDSGCTSASGGCVAGGAQEALARQQAENAGNQNIIANQQVSIQDSDVTFAYPTGEEPQITVNVLRTQARGNAMPTFFGKIFGISSVNVSAAATAEAFNPSGSNVPVGSSCLKPFLIPNCDPSHTSPANNAPNTSCATQGMFFDSRGNILHGGASPNGVIGQSLKLHSQAAPSQWYEIAFGGSQSKSQFKTYVEQCASTVISCGSTLQTLDGKAVGPTDQSINSLIHASGDGLNQGQDSIDTTSGPPFLITGGSNNPYNLAGKKFYSPSDSIVNTPVYDGHQLNPGKDTVTVIGYMQLFVQDVIHKGNDDEIDAVILNIGGCGGTAGSTTPAVTSTGGSPIPIRLIRTN